MWLVFTAAVGSDTRFVPCGRDGLLKDGSKQGVRTWLLEDGSRQGGLETVYGSGCAV
jgi:hypothetical protein